MSRHWNSRTWRKLWRRVGYARRTHPTHMMFGDNYILWEQSYLTDIITHSLYVSDFVKHDVCSREVTELVWHCLLFYTSIVFAAIKIHTITLVPKTICFARVCYWQQKLAYKRLQQTTCSCKYALCVISNNTRCISDNTSET